MKITLIINDNDVPKLVSALKTTIDEENKTSDDEVIKNHIINHLQVSAESMERENVLKNARINKINIT